MGRKPPWRPQKRSPKGRFVYSLYKPFGFGVREGFPLDPKIQRKCLSPHSTTRGTDASRLTRPLAAWMPLASLDHKKGQQSQSPTVPQTQNNFSPISTDVFANSLAHHKLYMEQAAQLFLLYRQHHTLNTHTKFLSSHLRQFH